MFYNYLMEIARLNGLKSRVRTIRSRATYDQNALVSVNKWDGKTDLRATSITRFIRVIIGLNISLLQLASVDDDTINKEIRLAIGENSIDIEQYKRMNENFVFMGFISSLFSIVEVALREYLKNLDKENYDEKWNIMTVCNKLFDKMSNKEDLELEKKAFNFLRLIRNSLHSNGVFAPSSEHDKKKSSILYKGKTYNFIIGERPAFVTWELLLDIAEDMKTLLFKIPSDKTINSISALMLDTKKV